MLVSVITPTHNRPKMLERCIEMFLAQDYPEKELLIIGLYAGVKQYPPNVRFIMAMSPATIGKKRNYGCMNATGEIIIHADDDDWRKPDWISKSVEALLTGNVDIVGLNSFYFYDLDNEVWYFYSFTEFPFITGATFCYRKSFWEKYPFKDEQIGEDINFMLDSKAVLFSHGYIDGFVASIHRNNTSKRKVETNKHYRKCTNEEEMHLNAYWYKEINGAK